MGRDLAEEPFADLLATGAETPDCVSDSRRRQYAVNVCGGSLKEFVAARFDCGSSGPLLGRTWAATGVKT
jgi:hypothetical protein